MFGGFGIGGFELIVLLAVTLVAFGPDRLPELARHIAKFMKMFQDAGREIQSQLNQMDFDLEREKRKKEANKRKKEALEKADQTPPQLTYDDSPTENPYDSQHYEYGGSYLDESTNNQKVLDQPQSEQNQQAKVGVDSSSSTVMNDPEKTNDTQRYNREMGD